MASDDESQQSTCQPAGSLAPSAQTAARRRFLAAKRVARTLNRCHRPATGATPVDAEPAQVSVPLPRFARVHAL